MRRGLWIVIAVVIVLAIVGGIIYSQRPRPEENVIKVGAILPLTGPLSYFGELNKRGIDMAAEDINASGGINGKKLEIVYGDNKGEAKEGVTIAQRFISQENIKIIIATPSPVVMAIKPILEKAGVLFLGLTPHPDLLKSSQYAVRVFPSAVQDVSTLAEYLVSNSISPVFVFYIQDDYGKGNLEVFKEKVGGKIEIAGVEEMRFGQADFRTQLAKVKSLNVKNLVIFEHGGAPTVSLLKQARELIPDIRVFGNLSFATTPIRKLAPEITNGCIFSAPSVELKEYPTQAKDFVKRYQERFHSLPGQSECFAYDAIRILASALGKVQKIDPLAIRAEIVKIKDYMGVSGHISFLPDGDMLTDFVLATYKDGKVVPLKR